MEKDWKNRTNKRGKWKKFYNKKRDIDKIFSTDFSDIFKKEKQKAIKNLETLATRKSSEKILTALNERKNMIIGGSADLAGSNNTKTKNHKPISRYNFKGNYIHYGVREHAMCGIMNGLSLHSKFIPYGGTFFNF